MHVTAEEGEERDTTLSNKNLIKVLSKVRIQDGACVISVIQPPPTSSIGSISVPALPTLLQDIIRGADEWGNDGKTGRIDPFTEIYDVSCFWSVRI